MTTTRSDLTSTQLDDLLKPFITYLEKLPAAPSQSEIKNGRIFFPMFELKNGMKPAALMDPNNSEWANAERNKSEWKAMIAMVNTSIPANIKDMVNQSGTTEHQIGIAMMKHLKANEKTILSDVRGQLENNPQFKNLDPFIKDAVAYAVGAFVMDSLVIDYRNQVKQKNAVSHTQSSSTKFIQASIPHDVSTGVRGVETEKAKKQTRFADSPVAASENKKEKSVKSNKDTQDAAPVSSAITPRRKF